ncbi:M23 family metallopeptidase [Luteimonas sp. RD2P54]|uniref:M23 family metallopeptidase n=1 Tax=Luteimonas endophytica TaxID=3042023 RepID=A0ABT6J9L2_9GAMM|nr:M23 family metallopeptidase [Luteimonas endophytica]MDH5822883.1 M23 family metallopeptidase [Luteimonas endophytica]
MAPSSSSPSSSSPAAGAPAGASPVAAEAAPAPARPASPPATGAGALLVPVRGVPRSALLDTFSDARGAGRRHDAIDIIAPAGTPVLAVADGHVEKLFDSERGGLTIYQFDPARRFAYYYGHLQAYAPGLAEGQRLRRGQVIGTVGSTGNASPGAPHLHFAIFRLGPERNWWEGEPLNPFPFLRDGTAPR